MLWLMCRGRKKDILKEVGELPMSKNIIKLQHIEWTRLLCCIIVEQEYPVHKTPSMSQVHHVFQSSRGNESPSYLLI